MVLGHKGRDGHDHGHDHGESAGCCGRKAEINDSQCCGMILLVFYSLFNYDICDRCR